MKKAKKNRITGKKGEFRIKKERNNIKVGRAIRLRKKVKLLLLLFPSIRKKYA